MKDDARPPVSARLAGAGDTASRPTIGALVDALGAEGPAPVLLVLAVGALVPGAAPVFAFALMPLAAALLLGRERVALPERLRARPVSPPRVRATARRLAWCERWFGLDGANGAGSRVPARVVAAALLFDALLVVLPIPVGNLVPALAAVFLAGALASGRRALLAFGLALSVLAVVYEVALVRLGIGLVRAVAAATAA